MSAPVTRSARLVFVGDVMSHAPQVTAAAHAARLSGQSSGSPASPAAHSYTAVFRHFRPIFEGADVAIANLETTLRTSPPYTGYPAFAAPAALAFDLRRAGIRIVTTANNHIADKGVAGVRTTLAILDSAGLAHTGVFLDSTDRRARNPLRFTVHGLRFALLAYTYGINGPSLPKGVIINTIDTVVIARDLDEARRGNPDCIIIAYHWGEEYRSQPVLSQRRLAEWTHARGADVIIGTHPHVVEPIEVRMGGADSTETVGATYYSLGNFVSNQRQRRTDGGIVAEMTLTRVDPPMLTAWSPATIGSRASRGMYWFSMGGVMGGVTPGVEPQRRFDFAWRPAWVHLWGLNGHRQYEVLPAPAFDSLPTVDGSAAAAFRFLSDTRTLLATDSLAIEK
jgi:poly-gamma-glutamate synthesis protein (capsule biosynthesis protein)